LFLPFYHYSDALVEEARLQGKIPKEAANILECDLESEASNFESLPEEAPSMSLSAVGEIATSLSNVLNVSTSVSEALSPIEVVRDIRVGTFGITEEVAKEMEEENSAIEGSENGETTADGLQLEGKQQQIRTINPMLDMTGTLFGFYLFCCCCCCCCGGLFCFGSFCLVWIVCYISLYSYV
jgi:hypothetical protein